MPTFTLVIADEPFGREVHGPAPYIETIEHGVGAHRSTPATEAYRRCLDAIANPAADEEDDDYVPPLPEELDMLAEDMEFGVALLESIADGTREDGFNVGGYAHTIPDDDLGTSETPGMAARERLRWRADDVRLKVETALRSVQALARWPKDGEDADA